MSEKVDVIVVGAGLAGLGAAYHLAAEGLEVLVVERGDYPGSKNVSGGRLYLNPVRKYYPDLFREENLDHPPFERRVVKERLSMLFEEKATTLEFQSARFADRPTHSVTLLRSTFDRWFGDRVAEKGAILVSGYKVDELVWQEGKVAGISSAGDQVRADVVIAADGALSFIAQQAELRPPHPPQHFALGIKEVIELPAARIEDRFLLQPDQGAAHLFFGDFTQGMLGGGFIYTNRQSLSLGLVIGIQAMLDKGPEFQPHDLLEAFKERPAVRELISNGNIVEYSAHAIPESAQRGMKRLVGHGLVVVGDAAGLALNMGITVRGMDFALASGALAAKAILAAREKRDFSEQSLSMYEAALRRSFVLQDQQTFAQMPEFLENPRLYLSYPQALLKLLENLFWIGDGPKEGFWDTIKAAIKPLSKSRLVRDLCKARRL